MESGVGLRPGPCPCFAHGSRAAPLGVFAGLAFPGIAPAEGVKGVGDFARHVVAPVCVVCSGIAALRRILHLVKPLVCHICDKRPTYTTATHPGQEHASPRPMPPVEISSGLIPNLYPGTHMTTDTAQTKKPAGSKPLKKLTRAQIAQGLDQFPVEHLLSAGKGKVAQLTHKQREFARHIALGKTKAQAYRESYTQTPAHTTITQEPYRLAADPRIAAEIEAYRLAIEAEKHRTPQQLKAMLVQQLVQHSLDDAFPPAQRVQCLKLLGSLFEVGAFVERKEVTTIARSGDIRARIMETLRDVTDVQAIDTGMDLMEELAQAKAPAAEHSQEAHISGEGHTADPTAPPPAHSGPGPGAGTTHTIPHTESPEKNFDEP